MQPATSLTGVSGGAGTGLGGGALGVPGGAGAVPGLVPGQGGGQYSAAKLAAKYGMIKNSNYHTFRH